MFQALVLAGTLLLSGPGNFFLAQSKQDPAPSSPQTQTADSSDPSSASVTAREMATTKPRKIYTNEDRQGSGSEDHSGSLPTGIEQVNTNANPNWRCDALASVALVRRDAEWRGYLRDFYSAQFRLCILVSDQRTDMARTADPHNVTPQEIVLAEKV